MPRRLCYDARMGLFDRWRRPKDPTAEREIFRDHTSFWRYEIGKELDYRGRRYLITRVESGEEPGMGFPIYIVYGRPVNPAGTP